MRIIVAIVFVFQCSILLYGQVFSQTKSFSNDMSNIPWISDYVYCSNGSYYVLINYEDSMYTSDGNHYYMPYDVTYAGTLLLKYSPQNELMWAKNMRGSLRGGLELDSQENLIMSGRVVFPLILDGDTLTATNLTDGISTLKFSYNGEFLWSKSVDCNQYEWFRGVQVDEFDAVYTLIEAMYSIDCDPSEEEYILTGPSNFTVLQKLDADGNFVWARSLNSAGGFNVPLSVDLLNNTIYIRGRTEGTADFDPDPDSQFIIDPQFYEGFLWKLNLEGQFVDAEIIPWFASSLNNSSILKVRSDNTEFLLENSAFMARRFDSGELNYFITEATFGDFEILDFDLGSNGDIYLVGYYTDSVTLIVNGVGQTFFDFNWNSANGMLLTINDLGEIKSAKPFMGNSSFLRNVKCLENDAIAIHGTFWGDICFDDPGNECYSYVFTSPFLNKYGLSSCSQSDCDLFVYPNPANDVVTVQSDHPFYNSSLFLVDVSGNVISAFESIYGNDFQFDISTLSSGIYFLAYEASDGTRIKKLVKE